MISCKGSRNNRSYPSPLFPDLIRTVICFSSAIRKCSTFSFICQRDYSSVLLARHLFILLLTALLANQILTFLGMLGIKQQTGLMLETDNCWLKSMIIFKNRIDCYFHQFVFSWPWMPFCCPCEGMENESLHILQTAFNNYTVFKWLQGRWKSHTEEKEWTSCRVYMGVPFVLEIVLCLAFPLQFQNNPLASSKILFLRPLKDWKVWSIYSFGTVQIQAGWEGCLMGNSTDGIMLFF